MDGFSKVCVGFRRTGLIFRGVKPAPFTLAFQMGDHADSPIGNSKTKGIGVNPG